MQLSYYNILLTKPLITESSTSHGLQCQAICPGSLVENGFPDHWRQDLQCLQWWAMPSSTIHGKMWFLGSYSEFAHRSTKAILHVHDVSHHKYWPPCSFCPHAIRALNTDLSGLEYNESESSVNHRHPVIPIFGGGGLKCRETSSHWDCSSPRWLLPSL